jgi:hypothetical protein
MRRKKQPSSRRFRFLRQASVIRKKQDVKPIMKTHLATFVCVWHPDTDELLFEGHSTEIGVDLVRKVVGEDAFPADPEAMTAHPISVEAGRKLLSMMGLHFAGVGEFQVSREYIRRPTVQVPDACTFA